MSMQDYEAVVIFSVKNGDEAASALSEKFKSLIEEQAELVSVDEWGRRKLAYPINYEEEGYYVLYTFKAESEFPAEFKRVASITDDAIRALVVKLENPAEAKSAPEQEEAPGESSEDSKEEISEQSSDEQVKEEPAEEPGEQ